MKHSFRLVVAGLFCLFSAGVFAESVNAEAINQLSRSVGKRIDDNSIDLRTELKTQSPVNAVVRTEELVAARDGQARLANRYDQYFTIYDADVELLADMDGDGFHHLLNVIFDVDVDHDHATLYAKLYLSREGGPWVQYATTNLFEIYSDDAGDTYEMTTELLDGYFTGYYSVLIEIYSLNHSDMVASEIVDEYYLGKHVTLEDLHRDEPVVYQEYVYEEVEVVESYGAGSFSLFLWLMLVQVVIVARGAFRKSSRINEKKKKVSLAAILSRGTE